MKARNLSLIAAFSALALPSAFANHIDFLFDGGFSISADTTGIATVNAAQAGAAGNILGSERNVSLTADLGTLTATLAAPIGPGPVALNTATANASILGVTSNAEGLGTLDLLYNGVGAAGLGGSDFDTRWNFIGINLPSVTGTLDVRVNVTDSLGKMGQVSRGGLMAGGNYFFSFTDPAFTNAGVNFSSVNAVSVHFETVTQGTAFQVGSITREAIPEPTSALLAGFGALGLMFRRRRNV